MTDDGLVLTFDRKFYYQTAYRNIASVREAIQKKAGAEVNVVLAFSDNPNNAVSEEPADPKAEPEQPAIQETSAPQPEQNEPEPEQVLAAAQPVSGGMSEEQKNLINDLILCFDGREEN